MKRLIVNADDFGLTDGVNRAVVELSGLGADGPGVLTSATMMARAGRTLEAAALALESPRLAVGCHVVLVDGEPVLPAAELPTLVDPATGRFRRTLGVFVRDLLLGRIAGGEIEAEASAQMMRLQAMGLTLSHADTHKHTHMFASVLQPLLRALKSRGIGAIRNPFEPAWSVAATANAPALRRLQVRVLGQMQGQFRRAVLRAGVATTDGAIGVLATGTLDARVLASLLGAMPDGDWELVTHPGYNDAPLAEAGTRLLASRELELDALRQVHMPQDVQLQRFSDL